MDTAEILKGPGGIISKVYKDSIADEIGLQEGDVIYQINGQKVRDLIDFEYLWAEENIELLVYNKIKQSFELFEIEKDYDEGLGAEFTSGVFDKVRRCSNKCIFCFVDQMPEGLRPGLYEKDDDYRLSFLQGNFITLTNLSNEDRERIVEQKLSPLYVSVQSADETKRVELLRNPRAASIIDDLEYFTSRGIEFHTQIVLCKGINDGLFLENSIKILEKLSENILSLAIVPAGITKYRPNAEMFPEFTKEDAEDIIEKVQEYQKIFREKRGSNFVYLADEFYIKAEKDFPEEESYDGFPQLENGIGLSRIFIDEYLEMKKDLPSKIKSEQRVFLVSGKSPERYLKDIVSSLDGIENLEIKLLPLVNNFFGSRVTVTGLLTGSDLLEGLKSLPEGSRVIIPQIMLKKGEDLFLDGLRIKDVSDELKIKIEVFDNSFYGLAQKLFNINGGVSYEADSGNSW